MKKKHPEIPIEKPIYECSYCHKSFASSISCKKHEHNKVCQKENPSSSSLATQEAIEEVIESIYTQLEAKPPIPDIIRLPLPPSPLQIPEIVAESDFEESPIKNEVLNIIFKPESSPSIVYRLLQSPIVKWIKYIGCTLWMIRMVKLHS
jgi:hypothetical protein